MSKSFILPAVNYRGSLPIFSRIFTILAVLSLAFGSLILSLSLFGANSLAVQGSVLLIISLPMCLLVGLLSMIALLFAWRWVAAALAIPMAIGVFFGLMLFVGTVMPHAPAGIFVVTFVVLLLLLNGGALWLARRFLTRTFR